jgi:hypothetical protein
MMADSPSDRRPGKQKGRHHETENAKEGLLLRRADGGNQRPETDERDDVENHAAVKEDERTLLDFGRDDGILTRWTIRKF